MIIQMKNEKGEYEPVGFSTKVEFGVVDEDYNNFLKDLAESLTQPYKASIIIRAKRKGSPLERCLYYRHTRNNMEQEAYRKALEEHYGNKLVVIYNEGVCSYSYDYYLKEEVA